MIGTLEHIVSQMNINSDTFTFEYGKRGYINVLEDELLLPAVIYDTESIFNLTPSQSGFIGEGGRAILSFMYKSELEWTPKQHYDNCIEPAINAARQFISLCQASELIEEISVGDGREFINLLDKNTSGIQFPFSIKLRVDKNVCVNYTPADNCQPVILTINGVEVETILSGAVFPLKVTLDGTQTGTYNEATETWEVESEPCEPIRVTFDNHLIEETSTDLNIDCSTYLNMAILSNNADVNGNWIEDGTNLGKPLFRYENDSNGELYYDGTRWHLDLAPMVNIQATLGNEAYPWLATWSGVTVVEGTIENYCGGGVCADATVENSDATYSNTVASGGNLGLPDITITKPDASTVTFPSVKNVDIRDYKSGIAYQRPSLTGQLTSYRTGDDGWNLANGVYDYTPPEYPTSFAKLDLDAVSPFTTLLHNNAFGNKNRFTDSIGGQTYANDYVIDHLTGLGYYRVIQGTSTTWDTNIDNAVASTLLSFTDWRVCNFQEYDVIGDRSMVGFNYAPFNLNGATVSVFQTSTTRNDSTTQYIRYQISTYVQSVAENKTTALASRGVLYVRNHY